MRVMYLTPFKKTQQIKGMKGDWRNYRDTSGEIRGITGTLARRWWDDQDTTAHSAIFLSVTTRTSKPRLISKTGRTNS
jgi:hypothetical protein